MYHTLRRQALGSFHVYLFTVKPFTKRVLTCEQGAEEEGECQENMLNPQLIANGTMVFR